MRKIFTLLVLLCATVMALQAQFTENFESGPNGWTAENLWRHGNSATNGSTYFPIPGHTNFMSVNDDAAGQNVNGSGRLISPPIDLTGLDFPFVKFDAFFVNGDFGGDDETAKVFISDNGGANWKEIADLPGAAGWVTIVADATEYGNKTIQIAFDYNDGGGFNYGLAIDDVEFYQGPAHDVRLVSLDIERFLPAGDLPLTINVMNQGYETVTEIEYSWTDGGGMNTAMITGLNIAPLQTAAVVHPEVFTGGTEAKQYDLAVSINMPNGMMDANMMDNSADGTASFVIDVPNRVVVAEEKTGTWCTWCPRGDIFLRQMVANYPDNFIGIAVHNDDPMEDAEYDGALNAAFPGGYPNVIMDRVQLMDPSAMPSQIGRYLAKTSPVSVDGSAHYNGETNEIEVTMTVSSHTEMNGIELNVSAVLIENEMSGTTSGWAQVNAYSGGGQGPMGGYENLPNPVPASQMVYDHVGRKLIGGFTGDATVINGALVDGTQATATLTASVPDDARRKKMDVVLLVTDRATGEIYNAGEIHDITGIYPRFSAAADRGCGPFEVQFFDDSDSTATSMWTFEGGTPATSTEKNPIVVLDGEGALDVRLDVVSNTGISYTVIERDIVTLDTKPTAKFEYESEGETVSFFDKSDDSVNYSWEFGDGVGSTKRNPEHDYNASGFYTVTLTTKNNDCEDTFTEVVEVILTGVEDVLESSWSLSAAPNPFTDEVIINYDLGNNDSQSQLVVYNYMGQELFAQDLNNQFGNVKLGAELPQGIFFVQVRQNQKISQILKVTKVK